MAKLRNINLEG